MKNSSRVLLHKELLFIIPMMIVYVLNRLFKNYIDIPVIGYLCRCHLNDFIGGGVFLCYINILLIMCKQKPNHSIIFVLIMTLLASVCWEYIAPIFLVYSVSDPYDVAAYILGGIFYMEYMKNYFIIRKLRGFRRKDYE